MKRSLSVMNAEVNPANTTIEDAYGELCDMMDAAREVKEGLNEALRARWRRSWSRTAWSRTRVLATRSVRVMSDSEG